MSQSLTLAKLPATVTQLDNGLTIIHQELTTPVAVVDVWVKAGVIQEPETSPGMAHFLEHMIFKGTEQLAPGVFDWIIENLGGVSNAATSYDYAHFFINTAATHLKDTITYLGELLLQASIPDEEFDREREVVMEEIRQAQDDPDWLAFQALIKNLYPNHPYGRSVLGSQIHLMQQTPQQMRQFHQQIYQPENLTVAIVGGIEQEKALEMAIHSFSNFKPRDRRSAEFIPLRHPPAQLTEVKRTELSLPRLEQARLLMAWTTPGVDELSTCFGLDLISVLLASGRSSRLVRSLREELELVQGIYSSFSLQREASLFTITAWLAPQDLERVEQLILASLQELINYPITEPELARCQRQLCNDYAFSTETPDQLAGLYGYYSTIAHPEQAVSYLQRIQALTVRDVQQLTAQYLPTDRYAVTVMKPLW